VLDQPATSDYRTPVIPLKREIYRVPLSEMVKQPDLGFVCDDGREQCRSEGFGAFAR
jgi:hypothetical protein